MPKVRGILTSKEVIISVISLVLGSCVTWWIVSRVPQAKADDRLAIVDVGFGKNAGGVETLDVSLRNAGDVAAFVKQVRLDIKKQWTLQPQFSYTSAAKPTGEYEVVLPVMRAPFSVIAPLFQTVAANETDQFRLNVNSYGRVGIEHQLFLVALTLVYNETSSEVTSGPFVIAMGPHLRLGEMYSSDPNVNYVPGATVSYPHPNNANVALAREIAALSVRKSPFASAIVKAVLPSEKNAGKQD